MSLRCTSLLLALGALLAACSHDEQPLSPNLGQPQFSQFPGNGPEKITFQSNRTGNFDIFVMNADGSEVTQLTSHPFNDLLPIFSPDGSRITFGRCGFDNCDVVVINADGSGERTIVFGGFPGAWSPDGNQIALSTSDGLSIVNADGTGLHRVAEPFGVTDWSPDGRQLLLGSDRDGDNELYAMNVDGSGVTQLTHNTCFDVAGTGWSPDGTRIVFSNECDGDLEILVMNADGSGVQQLTHNDLVDASPVWSPDGTRIAFDNLDPRGPPPAGDAQIFVMNADGTGITQLTFDAGVNNSAPHWIRQISPSNDDFANASSISNLPFSQIAQLPLASAESGDPTPSCASFYGPVSKTVWYSFTPTVTQLITAQIGNASISSVVAAYSGNSLGSLTELGCVVFGGNVTFRADAGTTYHFLVGGLFGQSGQVEFRLDVTPPPIASFGFYPGDPSIFDAIQFFDQSYDPGGFGIATRAWQFGDGGTGTDCCPTHKYAADGSYTIQLAVTTPDGRSASTSQSVLVKTHDVAITKFSAPTAASAGQTRQLTVGLNSKRYPETVEVQLLKSVPGGYQFVGSLTQPVPMRASNRTTDFNFNYAFTNADAQLGKVTFKAVANVLGGRDALPADNEAIAPPTKVSTSTGTAVRCLRPPAGLKGWWPGDGNARDIIGGNDATLQGDATFAAAKVLSGFSFDGAGDVAFAAGTAVNDLQQLTIDAWVRSNSLPPGRIERYVTLGGEKAVLRYDGFAGSGVLHFYMRINGQLQHVYAYGVLQVGVFQHVTGSYDGAVMRLYLDGVEVGSLPVTGTVDPGINVELSSSGETLDGLLDEVHIFGRALTASEVRAIFEADAAGLCKKGAQ